MKFLIAGQGLAGTCLAWQFHRLGLDFTIVDPEEASTSSLVAAGLMTPITGKDLDPSWRFRELMATAREFYTGVGRTLGISFFQKYPVRRVFLNDQEMALYESRCMDKEFADQAGRFGVGETPEHIHAPLGGFSMEEGARLNVAAFVMSSREWFRNRGWFRHGWVSLDDLSGRNGKLAFDGESYDAVIFCRGYREGTSLESSFLPFEPSKGQMLRLQFRDGCIPVHEVWNQRGLWIMPEPESGPSTFLAGATYHRMQTEAVPTSEGRSQILERLARFFRFDHLDMKIRDQPVGIRPVIRGWKLLVSPHPSIRGLYFINGLGSKGALRAPYFSAMLARHLLSGLSLDSSLTVTRSQD